MFAAIAGVPLEIPTRATETGTATDWDALLGAPDSSDRNNFAGRDSATALDAPNHAGGAISMRPNNPNRDCPNSNTQPVVPACRRGTVASCEYTTASYFALPSRRIVEVARRFDEEPMCNGRPCHNGLVTSVCATDYSSAMALLVSKIREHLPSLCLGRAPEVVRDTDGATSANCSVQEVLPPGATCDATRGRIPALDADHQPRMELDASGARHAVCLVQQVPTGVDGAPRTDLQSAGWYYDARPATDAQDCRQRVSFTRGAGQLPGATAMIECVEPVGR